MDWCVVESWSLNQVSKGTCLSGHQLSPRKESRSSRVIGRDGVATTTRTQELGFRQWAEESIQFQKETLL